MTRAWLITGAGGMLGTALQRLLAEEGARFTALDHAGLDITDMQAVEAAVRSFAEECARDGLAGIVVNAAAFTDVERAEREPEAAFAVNEAGAANVAHAAAAAGLGFVHVSTDFVFDGTKGAPYVEADTPRPLSVYGTTKLAGERAVEAAYPGALIVRTSWVYGPPGGGFPGKIIAAAATRDSLKVVDDEVGCPTYAPDLARGIIALLEAGAHGLYHLAGTGSCSRYELACEALRLAGLAHVTVEPVSSSEFPTAAKRPVDSRLECASAAAQGVMLPKWETSLGEYVVGISRGACG